MVMAKRKNTKRSYKYKNKNATTDDYGNEFGYDDAFAFIAGFTDGGAPYGISWEEIEKAELNEAKENPPEKIKYYDLPF